MVHRRLGRHLFLTFPAGAFVGKIPVGQSTHSESAKFQSDKTNKKQKRIIHTAAMQHNLFLSISLYS